MKPSKKTKERMICCDQAIAPQVERVINLIRVIWICPKCDDAYVQCIGDPIVASRAEQKRES